MHRNASGLSPDITTACLQPERAVGGGSTNMKPFERTLDPHTGFINMRDRRMLHKFTPMRMNWLEVLGRRLYHAINCFIGKPGIGQGVDNLTNATQRKKLFNPKIPHQSLQTRTILNRCFDFIGEVAGGQSPTMCTVISPDAMVGHHKGLSDRSILDVADLRHHRLLVSGQRATTTPIRCRAMI